MNELNLNKAAARFDEWMKRYEESHREHGTWDNHNKALLQYLNADWGFRYVKTYEQLCQLADLVRAKGYTAATNPPCQAEEFNLAIEQADPQSFGEVKPTYHEVKPTTLYYAALFSTDKPTIDVTPAQATVINQVTEDLKKIGFLKD